MVANFNRPTRHRLRDFLMIHHSLTHVPFFVEELPRHHFVFLLLLFLTPTLLDVEPIWISWEKQRQRKQTFFSLIPLWISMRRFVRWSIVGDSAEFSTSKDFSISDSFSENLVANEELIIPGGGSGGGGGGTLGTVLLGICCGVASIPLVGTNCKWELLIAGWVEMGKSIFRICEF